MFCHIFGEYLVKEKRLTQNQLSAALDYLQTIRVKLGFIAIAEKLLTEEQVTEINLMQNTMDRRFGDIAVTKGDLTPDQLNYLLSLQGNAYLQFVQAVTELEYLTVEEFEELVHKFQVDSGYTDEQLASIKSGDVDRVADVLIHMEDQVSNELARLCLRNINRFISNNFYFGEAKQIDLCEVNRMAYQRVKGQQKWFVGFSSDEEGLLSISNLYSKEVFDCLSDAAIESVQEFIHCTNGLYIAKLNYFDGEEIVQKPGYCETCTISSEGKMFSIPVVVNGKPVTIILGSDEKVNVTQM